jgi:hypothetical protein
MVGGCGDQVVVYDSRSDAVFPVVFDVWPEKMVGLAGGDMAIMRESATVEPRLEASPDAQSSLQVLQELGILRSVVGPGDATQPRQPLRVPDAVERQNGRVTAALRRIEQGLHLDEAMGWLESDAMDVPRDSAYCEEVLMVGADTDVGVWDGKGMHAPHHCSLCLSLSLTHTASLLSTLSPTHCISTLPLSLSLSLSLSLLRALVWGRDCVRVSIRWFADAQARCSRPSPTRLPVSSRTRFDIDLTARVLAMLVALSVAWAGAGTPCPRPLP